MKLKKILYYVAAALIIAAAAIFIHTYRVKISRVFAPFLMAIPLIYIVKPVSDKLAVKKIPIGISVLLVYLFFTAALAAVAIFFVPELAANARELMETLPELMAQYERLINGLVSSIKSSNWSEQVKTAIYKEMEKGTSLAQNLLTKSLEKGLDTVAGVVRAIIDLTVAMVIGYYVIRDGEKFRDQFLLLMPRRWRSGLIGTGKEIGGILAGFIQGQLMTALIVGIIETLGLMLIKMRYPLVLGMVGGLANIIPYFGPYIGAIPAVAIALIISPMKAVWTVAIFFIAQLIDNSFISPKMIESRVGLHPVATIFAVLAGGEFYGVLGMLLAVPAMAILRVLINRLAKAIIDS